MNPPAYLFGPFVGELSWEFFRFAPFAIQIKKEHPDITIIVLTRQSRFDLYGKYADIVIPFRIPNDVNLTRDCFKLDLLMTKDYNRIARKFKSQYKKRFEIVDHYYPDIRGWRYKLKWQFSRRKMAYDFLPRDKNKRIAERFIKKHSIFIDNLNTEYYKHENAVNSIDYLAKATKHINDYDTTIFGCMIEGLKLSRLVVGNLESQLSHLAILMKKPFICINNTLSMDSINLLNPLKTPILFHDEITGGIQEYDNIM
jgi:hypothetical protein